MSLSPKNVAVNVGARHADGGGTELQKKKKRPRQSSRWFMGGLAKNVCSRNSLPFFHRVRVCRMTNCSSRESIKRVQSTSCREARCAGCIEHSIRMQFISLARRWFYFVLLFSITFPLWLARCVACIATYRWKLHLLCDECYSFSRKRIY